MIGGFRLQAPWPPSGDQPEAILRLVEGLGREERYQTLLGVTGSGKTFTLANVVAQVQRPTLVIAHNKTLAAQLYSEFRSFFPDNAVEYFVSYYDYYQPEAYVAAQDLYIEKDASINSRIEKLRLATTKALLERRDVLVVASVSCIYGLGKRKAYEEAVFRFRVGEEIDRRTFLLRLVEIYYERNDVLLEPGKFRARGDVIEVFPAYSDRALRISFFDDEVERIEEIEAMTGKAVLSKMAGAIFPAKHYVTTKEEIAVALSSIEADLVERTARFKREGKLLEAQRLEMRTRYDMEMLSEMGYCSGIENYSRYLDGREPGEPPGTLLDFFPDDFLLVIDESHITLPQIRGMYNGDRARKEVLVDYGFRLPACLDNRPLRWEEFQQFMRQAIFVSATPGDWEREISSSLVEQVVRPTGVVDPEIVVSPASGQVDDLVGRLRDVVARGERALVTTLTKRASEDLAEYLAELAFKVRYIHSELDAFERADLLRDIRKGTFDVLVGVNLLREGIDLPEVSLVAILDADREGFLRSYRSIVQMTGRAARNVGGLVVLYADVLTGSLTAAIDETNRRRAVQKRYNEERGITPTTIHKPIVNLLPEELLEEPGRGASDGALAELPLEDMEKMMWAAVERLDFEEAARLRDSIAQAREGDIDRVASHRSPRSKRAQSKKYRRRSSPK
ncbi:excinuclease ABC subunit UvrB [Aminithiophilus ramosus]|uniref:UvrABC system protein B n=2 Tax=Synergistales TaxID=649776 RepID=A0A9Q7AQB6_9BACT|nr:excinuclease ABC subunit UvrB [Aminithiophilus ramosus]QTX33502.1 excinuclease ABC subunit UvrB [Aminithiophilus ramosus]QVL37357.1 excinuclease ABC subunit UvrB [Synergistota bacterium]